MNDQTLKFRLGSLNRNTDRQLRSCNQWRTKKVVMKQMLEETCIGNRSRVEEFICYLFISLAIKSAEVSIKLKISGECWCLRLPY